MDDGSFVCNKYHFICTEQTNVNRHSANNAFLRSKLNWQSDSCLLKVYTYTEVWQEDFVFF